MLATLGALLPPTVLCDGRLGDDASLALPEEIAAAAPMVQKRALEYLTGRTCARGLLRRLGFADAPLIADETRAPPWPDGVVGSISHTDGVVIAAVGLASDWFGLGIDVERRDAVHGKLEKYIATTTESERLAHIPHWRTIAFSSKESIFKALNPRTGLWLEFREVEIASLDDGVFRAHVNARDRAPFAVQGRYAVGEQYVFSTVALDPDFGLP